jgi:hypothetical protein
MNVESLAPMLRTWNIAATIEFYSRNRVHAGRCRQTSQEKFVKGFRR